MTKALSIAGMMLLMPVQGQACEVAQIMFGAIALDIIPYSDYESAIVRHADFKNPKMNFGAIKGEVTVDRGGFAVRNTNHVVIGFITPRLEISGFEGCDKDSKVLIKKVQPGAYVILNGDAPVGTIKGRFPKNEFGVP